MKVAVPSLVVGVVAAGSGFAGIAGIPTVATEVVAALAFALFAVALVLHLSDSGTRLAPGDEVE